MLQIPFPSFTDLLQVLMFLLALFVLVFHCFIKPYKKEASNVVETLILLNLLLVTAAYLEAPQDGVASSFIVILTVLPYLYAVCFLIWVAGKKMLVKYICQVFFHVLNICTNTAQSTGHFHALNIKFHVAAIICYTYIIPYNYNIAYFHGNACNFYVVLPFAQVL